MPSYYEFFAGAGLARLGLGAGWTCLWANDISAKKAAVYRMNFGDEELVVGDVAKVDPHALPPGADLAWASFPCQDLSLAGWRRGMQAGRSGTFWAFWRIMRDLYDRGRRPPIIVLENVVGLLSGSDLAGMCEALAALGMAFGALVVDAAHFLPQSRPRVFVVAVDTALDVSSFVEREPSASPWRPAALHRACRSLPARLQPLWRWWRLPAPPPHGRVFADLVEDIPDGQGWHAPEETRRLLDMMTDTNRAKVTNAERSTGRSVGTLYRRMRGGIQRAEVRFDGVAGCLRTPSGGSSRQTVLIVEGARARSRLLTPREAARLMGVPDAYKLPAEYNDAYFAMGDGVAVPAVAWLSRHVLTPLAEVAHTHAHSPVPAHATEAAPTDGDEQLNGHRERSELLVAQWESRGSAPR